MHRQLVSERRPRARAGFTLIELMISLVLFAMVGGALVTLLTRQQRFFRTAHEMIDRRAELRTAGSLLPTDLRPIYPGGGDVYDWRDSMIDFRQITGSSVACQVRPAVAGTQQVVLPPLALTRRAVLTSWIAQPEVGDSLMIYDEGEYVGSADDLWRPYRIAAVATGLAGANCNANFLTSAADLAAPAYILTLTLPAAGPLAGPFPWSVVPGAPIRIFRRARYSLFRQASDGKWYLGYVNCSAGCAGPPMAVSGPYRPYSATAGASGLTFTYRDTLGVALTPGVDPPRRIARIDVVTRTSTTQSQTLGSRSGPYLDSLRTIIGLRNRKNAAY